MKRYLFPLLFALLPALALLPAPAFADAPQVTAYKVTPPAHLTIGDHVNVSITVEADKGTQVQIAPGGIPDELSLAESAKFSTSSATSGRIKIRIDLVLAPFVIGDYPMAGIKLRYRDASGNTGDLQTPATRLTIESTVPTNAALQPRGLKPQAVIGAPPPPPYDLIAVAAGALVLAAALMYIAWSRVMLPARSRAAPAAEPEPLSPEDAARRALDGAGSRFGADADFAAYYAVLASTVRDYLTYRFGFPAFALTTVELQGQMVFRGMDRWQARLVGGLLSQCDAVIFAHYRPAGERADADLTAAYEIIEMSRPLPEPEQEVAAV